MAEHAWVFPKKCSGPGIAAPKIQACYIGSWTLHPAHVATGVSSLNKVAMKSVEGVCAL